LCLRKAELFDGELGYLRWIIRFGSTAVRGIGGSTRTLFANAMVSSTSISRLTFQSSRRPGAALADDGAMSQGRLRLVEIECNRCKTGASIPLDAIRRPRGTPIWKPEGSFRCRSCGTRSIYSAATPAVLLRWVQIALKPASKTLGLHRVFIRGKGPKRLIANGAFKRMQVDTSGACWLDADEHHLSLALRTGGAPNCIE
jgi:hypothetical protein